MKAKTKSAPASAGTSSVAKIMLRTIVSTSVRIFGPVLGLFWVGAACDVIFGTKPLAILIGIGLGVLLAAGLVFLQIQKIRREKRP
jgi:F0F1-type ATP synthase assembly protein I